MLGSGPGALTYTTAPFGSPQILGGPIDATLYMTSTTTETELAATVEAVSPGDDSVPLSSGASSQQPVVPGQVTRPDIAIYPTMTELPAGWRLRVTITTGDTPHLFPTAAQLRHLLGGIYQVERSAAAAVALTVPLAPASAFTVPCGSLCSPAGP